MLATFDEQGPERVAAALVTANKQVNTSSTA